MVMPLSPWHGDLKTPILAWRQRVTTEQAIVAPKYREPENAARAASFIRGSAWQRDVAPVFNPRCSHDDHILPRGRDRSGLPAADESGVRADHCAGPCCTRYQNRAGEGSASYNNGACGKEGRAAANRSIV